VAAGFRRRRGDGVHPGGGAAGRRSLSVEGCRILARQFRDKVEAHQVRAAALVGNSLACPFDLHRLLPMPDSLLQLGPTHPDALAWLAREWGISDRLHQVMVRDNATAGRPSKLQRTREGAAAARPHGDRLRFLHRRRHAARGDQPARGTLAGAAPGGAAAAGRLTGALHGRRPG
jgi:hypothetical protein